MGESLYVLTDGNLYILKEDPDFEDLYQQEIMVQLNVEDRITARINSEVVNGVIR